VGERRANKDGKPWKRGDGRWTARAYGPEPGAKPHYVYGKTQAEAREKRKDLEAELAAGLPAKDQTVGEYLEAWFIRTLRPEVTAGQLAESTYDSYTDNARKHIIGDWRDAHGHRVDGLGAIPLRRLSVSRVRQWQADLMAKPSARLRRRLRKGETKLPPPPLLSPRMVAYCHAILRRALNDARRDELVARNVATLVKAPKRERRERAALTKEQTTALLEASSQDRFWCYWLVVLTLGLRRGEGLGLRWSDIDFETKTIKLSLTVQRIRGDVDPATGRRKGQLVAKEMKTEGSMTTVPAGDGVLEALKLHQRQQRAERMRAPAWLDADLVFTTHIGTALEPRNVSRYWAAVCERAGVAGAHIHDLRHACGTYLADAGIHPKAIQTTLRHSRMATTEIYVHALDGMSREAAETMDMIVTRMRGASPGRAAGRSS
jgi:integrase